MDYSIKKITAREVLDSRGNPTVEAEVLTTFGVQRAIVPSGASTGKYEALELRDNKKRFHGKGVLKAVNNIDKIIAPKLIGEDCRHQRDIDETLKRLDGTENKSNLGANATLAVSMAICKSAASLQCMPLYQWIAYIINEKRDEYILPVPQFNLIDGGAHADIENDAQEHMIMPIRFKSYSDALQAGSEIFHSLKKILHKKFDIFATLLSAEGGFVPRLKNVYERLDIINKAIEEAGYSKDISLALDCAASEFFKDGIYYLNNKRLTPGELIDMYKDLTKTYRIVSIEDGMAEDDWNGWTQLTKALGKKIQIMGDDLTVTNIKRIKNAINLKAINSVLIKLNQIGTVSETIEAVKLSTKNKMAAIVSHRSSESEDTFIADLVVGASTGQSKFGGPARSERTAKYNQLLRLEEELGGKAKYAGKNFRNLE